MKYNKKDLMEQHSHSPLVSVITVCYNAATVIEATILSILSQTYPNVEYIIIDGGSTDGTIDVIKRYEQQISCWISEPDRGIYDAMNKGIAKSVGEWIHFLNAGDIYLNTHALDDFMRYSFEKRMKSDVLYGDVICKFNFGNLVLKPGALSDFESYFPISHPATLVKGKVLRENVFDISYRISADYELLYRLYHKGYLFEYVPIPLVLFDAITGISSTNPLLLYRENMRVQGNLGILKFYSGVVVIKVRVLLSFVINICLLNDFMRNSYRKKMLLRNKRFSEINTSNSI